MLVNCTTKKYLVIDTELEEIAGECYGEPSRKASGLRVVLEKFQNLFWSQTCISYFQCHWATINNSPGAQYKHTRGYICCWDNKDVSEQTTLWFCFPFFMIQLWKMHKLSLMSPQYQENREISMPHHLCTFISNILKYLTH